jgi:hypothetical protein
VLPLLPLAEPVDAAPPVDADEVDRLPPVVEADDTATSTPERRSAAPLQPTAAMGSAVSTAALRRARTDFIDMGADQGPSGLQC